MSYLELSGVSKFFGAETVVDAVDLKIEQGALFCLLGPSGCGKTTLLRLTGGYHTPHSGSITLDGDDITSLPPERRNIGMVFQNYALFPHLSARENVAFGLTVRSTGKAQRDQRVEAMLERVGLSTNECKRKPRTLSGGQQQRVALARALVIEPRLLLLDEPMANLDRRLRESMRSEIRDLQQRTGVTTLFVTHDQEEALSLATHLGIMMDGRIVQSGTPDDLYNRPADTCVARFLGETNLLQVQNRDENFCYLQGGIAVAHSNDKAPYNAAATVMIRPERIQLVNGGTATQSVPGRVHNITFMGADLMLDIDVGDACRLLVQARRSDQPNLAAGDLVALRIDPASLWPLHN